MATEPRNEERVCKAAKRLIEERDGGPLVDTECPDKTEHRKQAVELLFESPTKRYAIEHTRIESFPQQIADGKAFSCLLEPLETWPGSCQGSTRLSSPLGLLMAFPCLTTSESARW